MILHKAAPGVVRCKQASMHFVSASRLLLCALVVTLLGGCSNESKMAELKTYVDSVVSRPPGQVEPPPGFVSYVSFTYSAASLRSPFDIPVDAATAIRNQLNNQVKPDENRPKEYLESFALGALTMVGTLAKGGQTWALIKDEANNINRVTIGNYMGKSFGRIVSIAPTQIDVMEIVPTGDGGWIERPQSIVLLMPK